MKKLILCSVMISKLAWANLHLAPPDFESAAGRAVFVDFKTAQYEVNFNVLWKKTTVRSKIVFEQDKTGKALFDLIPEPLNATLDGRSVRVLEISSPDGQKLRMLDAVVEPGEHVLEIENSFKENVRYNALTRKVSSAFWIRDLKSRMFMEQYLPSNFEFDQYQMTMNINFVGVKTAKQDIYTNGLLRQISSNSFKIVYPEYFTASCPYFHTTPRGHKKRLDFTYRSIDGRQLPVTVYTSWWSKPQKFKLEAEKIFKELEADYGPWGHPSLVAYETLPGTGGMEHAGATQTSLGALDHEMLHSYFAKGVMPANGNSGWIDEAIASWRDYGYQRKPLPSFTGSDLGSGSVYQRNTDGRAYALGREFMAYIDYRLQDVGGLKSFLKGYFASYKHMVITTEHFKNNLEFFSGLDLTEAFDTYIWGVNSEESFHSQRGPAVHKALSQAELNLIL